MDQIELRKWAVECARSVWVDDNFSVEKVLEIASKIEAYVLNGTAQASAAPPALPAGVTVEDSVFCDRIISLIDGRPYKSLKRHLRTHGHTPESYRKAFGLPGTYPMVAADYSEKRQELAKAQGLGRPKIARAA